MKGHTYSKSGGVIKWSTLTSSFVFHFQRLLKSWLSRFQGWSIKLFFNAGRSSFHLTVSTICCSCRCQVWKVLERFTPGTTEEQSLSNCLTSLTPHLPAGCAAVFSSTVAAGAALAEGAAEPAAFMGRTPAVLALCAGSNFWEALLPISAGKFTRPVM